MATYASLADFRTRLNYAASNTSDDTALLTMLEMASAWFDGMTKTTLQPRKQARVYTPLKADVLLVEDLLAVTKFETELNSDGSYSYSWTSGQYRLTPHNAPLDGRPYWRIEITDDAPTVLPVGSSAGVRVTGTWGYYDNRWTAAGTLDGNVSSSATTVVVTSATGLSAGQTLLVEDEQLYVTAVSGKNLTVRRAQNGTSAKAHNHNEPIEVYYYPLASEAVMRVAHRYWRMREAPNGMSMTPDVGNLNGVPMDNDTRDIVQLFRRRRHT